MSKAQYLSERELELRLHRQRQMCTRARRYAVEPALNGTLVAIGESLLALEFSIIVLPALSEDVLAYTFIVATAAASYSERSITHALLDPIVPI